MSLKDKASLIFKPSRYKAGTAYSFRGTDFTFTRASTATRVNASGLIEDVASGVPRLSYDPADLTKDPALLLETERTNFLSNSNGFSSWVTYLASVTANATISPDGTSNAFKLINGAGTDYHFINYSYSGTTIAKSVFVKAAEYDAVGISSRSSFSFSVVFDLTRKTSTTAFDSGSYVASHGIEEYANGWFRVWVYVTSTVQMNIHAIPSSYTGTLQGSDMPGDGASGIFIWQAQIEGGAYPTSIIRTSGSTVTRSADSSRITTLQSSRIVSASSGTFMVEVDKRESPIFLNQKITVSGSSTDSSLLIDNVSGAVRVRIWNNSTSNVGTITTDSFPEGTVKYLIKWDGTNTSVFANGKFVGTAAVPNYAYAIYDMYEQTSFSNNNINEALFFPSALSDEECI
jgi:hypothetical protein